MCGIGHLLTQHQIAQLYTGTDWDTGRTACVCRGGDKQAVLLGKESAVRRLQKPQEERLNHNGLHSQANKTEISQVSGNVHTRTHT